jgi:hypothetical protein
MKNTYVRVSCGAKYDGELGMPVSRLCSVARVEETYSPLAVKSLCPN